ncbi:MAG: S-adenosylmethionine:tRNA ribosyltransferase-isomerase [Cytophagales bacterium]|nr:S-adenosylmethionine:tRNA ribosyltransferase-isomerase [Cytophagales bacterium]
MKYAAKDIDLKEYHYDLPEDRIAKFPLPERSQSKLLVYDKGHISHHSFFEIDQKLPGDSLLFFNNTRVIPARLHFYKDTGAHIEVFLLEPFAPTKDIASAMVVKKNCQWRCMVGNLKKWKPGQSLFLSLENDTTLSVEVVDREEQVLQFSWDSDDPLVDILQNVGKVPLPPYIKRELAEEDKERYQTVYSEKEGAVAAPTAGLHFDEPTLENTRKKGITLDHLTLHVSAGTFQPIKVENVLHHPMHYEQVEVSKSNVKNLLENEQVVAVGTTSMRTLESLYWYGVDLVLQNKTQFDVEKLRPYQQETGLPTTQQSLEAVWEYMDKNNLEKLGGLTEIFIVPGYHFKVCKGLITNYHLPGSTLILLIAAFIGEDWKKVYQQALNNDYRFLSYGDSSLLIPA